MGDSYNEILLNDRQIKLGQDRSMVVENDLEESCPLKTATKVTER